MAGIDNGSTDSRSIDGGAAAGQGDRAEVPAVADPARAWQSFDLAAWKWEDAAGRAGFDTETREVFDELLSIAKDGIVDGDASAGFFGVAIDNSASHALGLAQDLWLDLADRGQPLDVDGQVAVVLATNLAGGPEASRSLLEAAEANGVEVNLYAYVEVARDNAPSGVPFSADKGRELRAEVRRSVGLEA